MSDGIDKRAHDLGMSFEPTRPIFNLAVANRDIFDALIRQTPEIEGVFSSVEARIPLPASAVASVENHFYRLPNHNRSFCYSMAASESFIDSPVLVFKGSEPLLADFEVLLEWMQQAPLRKSSRVMGDHFPLAEGKIPGAMSIKEATREAEIAIDVQANHLAHYGELARLPVPLLIHSFSEFSRDRCAARLRQKLSQAAFEKIEPLLQSGLAIYVYYYPSAPIRANYWGDMAVPQLKQFVEKVLNEDAVIAEWVRLTVRLIYLGYLPYSVRNEGLGACMDFGNATLDGGFCDPDSIIPIDAAADDEFFRESVIQSLASLHNTVRMFLGISESSSLYPSIEEFACRQHVHQLLNSAIATEKRPGLRLDERFLLLLHPRSVVGVRSCARRKNRIPLYTYFARRHGRS